MRKECRKPVVSRSPPKTARKRPCKCRIQLPRCARRKLAVRRCRNFLHTHRLFRSRSMQMQMRKCRCARCRFDLPQARVKHCLLPFDTDFQYIVVPLSVAPAVLCSCLVLSPPPPPLMLMLMLMLMTMLMITTWKRRTIERK
jgi:hypothetical protein